MDSSTGATIRFYSSPSCDGDQSACFDTTTLKVSILPRLATGIVALSVSVSRDIVSILPRLATGIDTLCDRTGPLCFYSSPSCDGDLNLRGFKQFACVSILPRLATGISQWKHY